MQPAGLSASRLTALTNAMQGYVERGEVAGVVSMVWRRGEIGYFEPLGWRDEAAQLPMERDTLFRIASMTKPVTSAAILMLIEEDRLALDTPISLWLPELSAPRVLRDPAGPLDETDPARASLTVLDLLTHRAGFAYHFTATGPLAEAYADAFNGFEARMDGNAWLARIAGLPLMFQPGSRWHYGIATDVLGVLIERVSGMSLGEFFRTRIFEPLGMRDTAFWVPDAQLARLATAYGVEQGTRRRVVEDHPSSSRWANPDRFQSGGGGLVSTAQGLSAIRATAARPRTGRHDAFAVAPLRRSDALEFSDARPTPRVGLRSCAVGRSGVRPRRVHRRRSGAAVAARLSLDGLVRLAGCVWHELVRRSGGRPDRSDADSKALRRTVFNDSGFRTPRVRCH
jgi:CubicO group peptidase (beta-lactamase class C family)